MHHTPVRKAPDKSGGRLRFINLLAGLGGFHHALASLGHECVFACEIDPELADLYEKNFWNACAQATSERCALSSFPHTTCCAQAFPARTTRRRAIS